MLLLPIYLELQPKIKTLGAALRSGPSPSEPQLARGDHLHHEACQEGHIRSWLAGLIRSLLGAFAGIAGEVTSFHKQDSTVCREGPYSSLIIYVLRSVEAVNNILSTK